MKLPYFAIDEPTICQHVQFVCLTIYTNWSLTSILLFSRLFSIFVWVLFIHSKPMSINESEVRIFSWTEKTLPFILQNYTREVLNFGDRTSLRSFNSEINTVSPQKNSFFNRLFYSCSCFNLHKTFVKTYIKYRAGCTYTPKAYFRNRLQKFIFGMQLHPARVDRS